jgi:hypothetical protein
MQALDFRELSKNRCTPPLAMAICQAPILAYFAGRQCSPGRVTAVCVVAGAAVGVAG